MDFGTVLIAICLLAIVAGVASVFVGGPSPYESIGRGDLTFDEPSSRHASSAAGPASSAESDEEIRQMIQAKSDRRERRGEEPLDLDAELAALTRPAPAPQDPALREEVRQVVMARNERRVARGEEPLDVEAETDRQLQDLGG
ncbi:MAG: hypothetical protein H0V55_05020 [Thermoleophilaceae bacterium]|nr:hypothetical protein [Thermoleophilaceae bacterium]